MQAHMTADTLQSWVLATASALSSVGIRTTAVDIEYDGSTPRRIVGNEPTAMPWTLHFRDGRIVFYSDPLPAFDVVRWLQSGLDLWFDQRQLRHDAMVVDELTRDIGQAESLRQLVALVCGRIKILCGFRQVVYLHATDQKHFSCIGHWKHDGRLSVRLESDDAENLCTRVSAQLDRPCDVVQRVRTPSDATFGLIVCMGKWTEPVLDTDRRAVERIAGLVAPFIATLAKLEVERELKESLIPPLFPELIGSGPAMAAVAAQIRQLLDSGKATTVLIQGETGSGKEMIARTIHRQGTRRDRPFIAVNCGAIPSTLLESELFGHERGAFTDAKTMKRGKFELAHGGTLFLDEVGDLPMDAQVKLLRAIEERRIERLGATAPIEIDVHLIAATHVDLAARIREGRFREDLFYRLHVYPILMRPLRERPEDIPALVEHFFKISGRSMPLSDLVTTEALAELKSYSWPGNVRELRNWVERMDILGKFPIEHTALTTEDHRTDAPTSDIISEIARLRRELDALSQRVDGGSGFFSKEESDFLEALRQCHFRLDDAAARLSYSPFRIRDKLKGLCFKTLDAVAFDIDECSVLLAGSSFLQSKVKSRVLRYVENLMTLADRRQHDSYRVYLNKIPLEYRDFVPRVLDGMSDHTKN